MRLEKNPFVGIDLDNGIKPLDFNLLKSDLVRAAYQFAQQAHEGQKRDSGENYFDVHLRIVAALLELLFGEEEEELVAAGLLHDLIEDTATDLKSVERLFGANVLRIVEGVTNLSTPELGWSKADENFANLRKVTQMAAVDPRIWWIKLADRWHNGKTLQHVSPERASVKAAETLVTYCRILSGFGVYAWKRDLENTFFPYLLDYSLADSLRLRQKKISFEIVQQWVDDDPRRDPSAVSAIRSNLSQVALSLTNDFNMRVIRPSYWEVWRKMLKMVYSGKVNNMMALDQVNDLVRFEIVMAGGINQEDRMAVNNMTGLIKDHFGHVLIGENDGTRRKGELMGYELIISPMGLPVSVLVCTEEMKMRNDWGVIADYRLGTSWDHHRNPLVFFTPDRKMVVTAGSTALDAAASIADGRLVDRFSMVLVNNQPVSLASEIKNGDVVELVLSGKPLRPTSGWLNFVDQSNRPIVERAVELHGDYQVIEKGKMIMSSILAERGILNLEDLLQLRDGLVLSELGALVGVWVSPDSLYRALGCEIVSAETVGMIFDKLHLTKEELGWSSFEMSGSSETNIPGMMEKIGAIVKSVGGNVALSFHTTRDDRSFYMKMVVENLSLEDEKKVVKELAKLRLRVTVV